MKDQQLALLPHPNFVGTLDSFNVGKDVLMLDYANSQLHEYFARASVLVTDFSSMAFNAAYLKRPVVYYQFDQQAIQSGGHVGRAGYFDYDRDGFGPVVESSAEVIEAVGKIIPNQGPISPYRERIEDVFPFRDGNCSQRVTAAIKAIA